MSNAAYIFAGAAALVVGGVVAGVAQLQELGYLSSWRLPTNAPSPAGVFAKGLREAAEKRLTSQASAQDTPAP